MGIDTRDRAALPHDGRLRIADGLYLVGDVAGPELHTHQAHYQGQLAVRMALGDDVTPDYRALPRATYTDPELAFVGLDLDAATGHGFDAFEEVADFATSAKGYAVEATFGHVTIVVDRASRQLLGAAMAAPDASAAIHECVLAIRARVTDRRARGHHPRVPLDVTHPQRPVRPGRRELGPCRDGLSTVTGEGMERETRFELATCSLEGCRSAN